MPLDYWCSSQNKHSAWLSLCECRFSFGLGRLGYSDITRNLGAHLEHLFQLGFSRQFAPHSPMSACLLTTSSIRCIQTSKQSEEVRAKGKRRITEGETHRLNYTKEFYTKRFLGVISNIARQTGYFNCNMHGCILTWILMEYPFSSAVKQLCLVHCRAK